MMDQPSEVNRRCLIIEKFSSLSFKQSENQPVSSYFHQPQNR